LLSPNLGFPAILKNRQLRAYVYTVNKTQINFVPNTENWPRMDFMNGGSTPAYNPAIALNWGILPFPPDKPITSYAASEPGFHKDVPGDYIFKEHIQSIAASSPVIFNEQQIAALLDGSKFRFYFWGSALYMDVFHCRHYVHFCVMYGGASSKIIGGLTPCPIYNDTDEGDECQ
jgi:hypothetical protein